MDTVEILDLNSADEIADSKSTVAKRGYSIWSLLVIITLVAVLVSPFPRTVCRKFYHPTSLEYFVTHQLIIWTSIAIAVWMLAGRRLWIAYLLVALMTLLWTPIALEAYTNSTLHYPLLQRCGVRWLYNDFYRELRVRLNYEPISD